MNITSIYGWGKGNADPTTDNERKNGGEQGEKIPP